VVIDAFVSRRSWLKEVDGRGGDFVFFSLFVALDSQVNGLVSLRGGGGGGAGIVSFFSGDVCDGEYDLGAAVAGCRCDAPESLGGNRGGTAGAESREVGGDDDLV
jgi:hypothetical protein